MLDFKVLVKGTLRAIGALAGFNWTTVMSLNLVGCASEAFFAVFFVGLAVLDFLALLLKLAKAGRQLVAFVGQLTHLAEEDYIGQVQSAVLVIVGKVGFGVSAVHRLITPNN